MILSQDSLKVLFNPFLTFNVHVRQDLWAGRIQQAYSTAVSVVGIRDNLDAVINSDRSKPFLI